MNPRRPLQFEPYDKVFAMIPDKELGAVRQGLKINYYDYDALDAIRDSVASDSAKEILTRHEVYLYHKEEGRDI